MKNSIQYIILICFCFGLSNAYAQPDLPSEEVEVIKDFEAKLEETERLNVDPGLPLLDTTSRRLTYDIPTSSVTVDYLPPKLRPIATKGEKVGAAYNGYLKLGYGTPNSPLADLGYTYSKDQNLVIGGQVFHHSANNSDIENQRFSHTFGKAFGSYYFDQGFAVQANLGYDVDEVHYFGYDHETTEYSRDEVQQQYKTFDARARFFNGERTVGDINYDAVLDFYTISDNFASSENAVKLDFGGTKWFNDAHALKINLITDFTAFDDTSKQTLNNFLLQPNFTYHGGSWSFKAGVNLTSHKDKFRLFPDVEGAVKILGNKLTAFAGATGDLQKNTLRSLTDYNPFLLTRFQLRNTEVLDFYGGVRGNIKIFDYSIQGGFKNADNLALFQDAFPSLNPIDSLKFATIYDDADIIYVKGSVTLRPIKGLEILAVLSQNFYSLSVEDKAWHLPAFEFNTAASYRLLEDKLKLKAEMFIQDGVPFLALNGEEGELNALFDLSLGAEYDISKNFGLFASVNNIASNKRERWHRYRSYGINVMGGLLARF